MAVDFTELEFIADRALRDKLLEAQRLLGQTDDADLAEMLERAVDLLLVDLREKRLAERGGRVARSQ